jgi:YD repeat-containing protein
MSRKSLLILLGLGWLASSATHGQNQPFAQGGNVDTKMLPSVNGTPSNISNPNLFNGTTNVNIPIYSYGQDGISLSYNTAGVKVSEVSGMVGLHWALNAGGSITRNLKDIPDEMNVPPGAAVPDGSGDPASSTSISGKFAQYFSGSNTGFGDYTDGESDDFIFSVGGLSFTFNIGKDGFIFTNPHQNIKIDLLINNIPVTSTTHVPSGYNTENMTFKVRDAQGNSYYFIEGDLSKMTYSDGFSYQYISRWVIQKIVQSDGSEIDFQYTPAFISYNGSFYTMSAKEVEGTNFDPSNGIQEGTVAPSTQLVHALNISSINYPNNVKATFVYATPTNTGGRCDDPGNSVMTEIQISSDDHKLRYVFDQAYAQSTKSNVTTDPETYDLSSPCQNVNSTGYDYSYYRLLLKGIHMLSPDGTTTLPYYSFGYKTGIRLPFRFSGAQDYFGYYNGQTVTDDEGLMSIPRHQAKYSSNSPTYGAIKTDNYSYAQADLLDYVENGYGGVTSFTYGPQVISNVVSDAGITLPTDQWYFGANAGDGVFLYSITTSDDHYPGKYTKQSFSPLVPGQRFMPGGYFDFPTDTYYSYYANHNTTFNNTFVSPHQLVNGSNHGYSQIGITTTNETGQQLSYKTITYQNISQGSGNTSYYHSGAANFFQVPFTDKQYIKDWEIGLPLVTKDYDANNNLLSVTTNLYNYPIDSTSTIGKVENEKILATADGNGLFSQFATDNYRPYTGRALLTQTTTQKYIDDNNSITDVVSYDYDDHNNLVNTTAQNSRGENITLSNVYNYNVCGPNVPFGSQPGTLYDMTSDGLEKLVSTERWKNAIPFPFGNKLLDANITKYQYQNNKVLTKKLFTLQTIDPVSYTTYTGKTQQNPFVTAYGNIINSYSTNLPANNMRTASEVLQFDNNGNPIETQIGGQNSYISTIWDSISQNKVAEVQNARRVDIGYTSFESAIYNDPTSYSGNEVVTNGGFSYQHSGVSFGLSSTQTVSGSAIYNLQLGSYIHSPALTSGQTYVLTFWCKGTGVPNINGAGITVQLSKQYSLSNGWNFYKASFTTTASGYLNFYNTTSGAIPMDELRLFPAGALMKSWAYTPLFGTSSSTDPSGRITYYEYDAFGRLIVTRDQEGNIISKQDFHQTF